MGRLKLKTTATAGKVPAVADIADSELVFNSYDGKLFGKKKVGLVETVVDLTPVPTTLSLNNNVNLVTYGFITGSYLNWSQYGRIVSIHGQVGIPASGGKLVSTNIIPIPNSEVTAPLTRNNGTQAGRASVLFPSGYFSVAINEANQLYDFNFTYIV